MLSLRVAARGQRAALAHEERVVPNLVPTAKVRLYLGHTSARPAPNVIAVTHAPEQD